MDRGRAGGTKASVVGFRPPRDRRDRPSKVSPRGSATARAARPPESVKFATALVDTTGMIGRGAQASAVAAG